jgi:hypothetical protein
VLTPLYDLAYFEYPVGPSLRGYLSNPRSRNKFHHTASRLLRHLREVSAPSFGPVPPNKISPSTPFQSSHAVRKVELDGFISSKGPKHRAIMEHDGSLLHSLWYELT